MTAEETFWEENVKKDVPPAPDGSDSCTETIKALYPESSEDSVSLFAYENDLEQRAALSAQIKELEGIRDEIDNRIKSFMGEAGRGESVGYKVTWTSSTRDSFDNKRFAKENPTLDLSGYYKTSTYRTFKVTKIKK